MTTALQAARFGDQIGHTSAMKGLIAGLVIGFLVTGAILLAAGATVATGGAAAVVIGGLIAGTAGGGLAGMKIGKMFDGGPQGPITTGSPNTFLGAGARKAARATLDMVTCHAPKMIAQGSVDVFINKAPAARNTDMTQCSGKIIEGQPDVFFGGETGTYMDIEGEVPGWLVRTLEIAALVGTVIATGGAILTVGIGAALGGLAAGMAGGWAGGKVGGFIGGKLFGEKGQVIGEVIGEFIGSNWAASKGSKIGERLEAKLPLELQAKLPGQTPRHFQARAENFIKNEIPKLSFKTPDGKTPALWSGGEPALNGARTKGYATMEDTAGGKATEAFVNSSSMKNAPWDIKRTVWVESSKTYVTEAANTYGTGGPLAGQPIPAVVTPQAQANPNSVFNQHELPLAGDLGVNVQPEFVAPVAPGPNTPPIKLSTAPVPSTAGPAVLESLESMSSNP